MRASWHIIIVNFKTASLAADAARAARKAAPKASILVVDNGSHDDSKELIGNGGVARYLALPDNRGYGAALNAGAQNSDADYLLLLNADAQIGPDCVSRFQDRFESMPLLGVLAPRLLSPDLSSQPSCRRFPTYRSLLWSRGSPVGWLKPTSNRTYRVPEPNTFTLADVVAGACMAVRRPLWQQLGGMDEQFFLYAEDTDFCLRAKQAGWLVGYDPAVTVRHQWGASTRLSRRHSNRLHAESLSRYFRKHHPRRSGANLLVSWILRMHAFVRI